MDRYVKKVLNKGKVTPKQMCLYLYQMLRKTKPSNMTVTIADIFQYYNTYNPGPLEQGLEQGLTFILYVSFYVGLDCLKHRMLRHILNTHKVFLLCVFFCEFVGLPNGKKTCHMRGRRRAFLLCVFSYDSPDDVTERKSCHSLCRSISCPPCEFLYVSSGVLLGKKSVHTEGSGRVYLLYGFYCDSSGQWK